MQTPGIKTVAFVSNANGVKGDQVFTSNATLASVGLLAKVAPGQNVHIKANIPITVGATGGVRAQVVTPAGVTAFNACIRLNNTVAPSQTIAAQTASAAFTNALANAGTHWLEIEADVTVGATGGNIDIQLAQNTSDVLPLTVLRSGHAHIDIY